MPNRYIREAAIKSRAVNSLSWQGEVFWRRLLNTVDDFGRYDADPELLRAQVFPRQLDRVREADISRLLAECEEAGLLFRFEADQKAYLVMNQWEQGRALKSSYPPPPPDILERMRTHVYICKQMPPTPTPTLTPIPTPNNSDKASKPSVEGGSGGKPLRGHQADLAARFERALNGQWVNDAGKWVLRLRGHPEATERVLAEVENAIKEQRVTTSPAQYAEDTWKRFTK